MLESASPRARFIDGNENAYYYTSREQYFRAYHAIRERARGLLPADLRENYNRQVQAGQALYVDQNFALRQPNTEKYLSYKMTPEERPNGSSTIPIGRFTRPTNTCGATASE